MLKLFTICWGFVRRGLSVLAGWLRKDGRWKLALGAMTALLAALTIAYWVHAARSARDDLSAATVALRASEGEVKLLRDARAADAAALSERNKLRTIIITKEVQSRAVLDKALRDNPDWASTPVPDAVADSLRQD
jgi:hypothetical protein